MTGRGADDEVVALAADAAKFSDIAKVDDRAGRGQAKLHGADQALAAGHDLALRFWKQRSRVVDALGTMIFECVHVSSS